MPMALQLKYNLEETERRLEALAAAEQGHMTNGGTPVRDWPLF